ncbi:MAG: hypothetical protein WKG07_34205 [Hymenobacter sp.]
MVFDPRPERAGEPASQRRARRGGFAPLGLALRQHRPRLYASVWAGGAVHCSCPVGPEFAFNNYMLNGNDKWVNTNGITQRGARS